MWTGETYNLVWLVRPNVYDKTHRMAPPPLGLFTITRFPSGNLAHNTAKPLIPAFASLVQPSYSDKTCAVINCRLTHRRGKAGITRGSLDNVKPLAALYEGTLARYSTGGSTCDVVVQRLIQTVWTLGRLLSSPQGPLLWRSVCSKPSVWYGKGWTKFDRRLDASASPGGQEVNVRVPALSVGLCQALW